MFEPMPFESFRQSLVPRGRSKGWQQGEHLLLAAPTSGGKTTLASKLLPIRKHVVIAVTKIADPVIEKEFKGWTRLAYWPRGGPPSWETRILLWPKPGKSLAETKAVQKEVMGNALDAISLQGNRCVCIDEMLYFSDPKFLGLGNEIGMMHYFGRSSGISMVSLTQRPSWIPRVIYSSVSHALIARTKDREDAKRLADLGGTDARELGANLEKLLDKHDYVYTNPQGNARSAIINTRR